jgi:hypothetical protein
VPIGDAKFPLANKEIESMEGVNVKGCSGAKSNVVACPRRLDAGLD